MRKIKRIAAYQVDLPLHEGSYNWSGGKSVQVFDSTIVSSGLCFLTTSSKVGNGSPNFLSQACSLINFFNLIILLLTDSHYQLTR